MSLATKLVLNRLRKFSMENGKVQLDFGGLTYLVAKSGCSR
jgi:hypothetical protein